MSTSPTNLLAMLPAMSQQHPPPQLQQQLPSQLQLPLPQLQHQPPPQLHQQPPSPLQLPPPQLQHHQSPPQLHQQPSQLQLPPPQLHQSPPQLHQQPSPQLHQQPSPQLQQQQSSQLQQPQKKRTRRACINCHSAKVACSDVRPCVWCVRHGMQATCVDAPDKRKRKALELSGGYSNSYDYYSTQNNNTPNSLPTNSHVYNNNHYNNGGSSNSHIYSHVNNNNNNTHSSSHSSSSGSSNSSSSSKNEEDGAVPEFFSPAVGEETPLEFLEKFLDPVDVQSLLLSATTTPTTATETNPATGTITTTITITTTAPIMPTPTLTTQQQTAESAAVAAMPTVETTTTTTATTTITTTSSTPGVLPPCSSLPSSTSFSLDDNGPTPAGVPSHAEHALPEAGLSKLILDQVKHSQASLEIVSMLTQLQKEGNKYPHALLRHGVSENLLAIDCSESFAKILEFDSSQELVAAQLTLWDFFPASMRPYLRNRGGELVLKGKTKLLKTAPLSTKLGNMISCTCVFSPVGGALWRIVILKQQLDNELVDHIKRKVRKFEKFFAEGKAGSSASSNHPALEH